MQLYKKKKKKKKKKNELQLREQKFNPRAMLTKVTTPVQYPLLLCLFL